MNRIKLGVIVNLYCDTDISQEFLKARGMGFETCQLICWDRKLLHEENAKKAKEAAMENGIQITAFWCGWQGPAIWNFQDGPVTLGLVPSAYRHARMETLIQGGCFAQMLGVTDIATHLGFIPESPNDPEYRGVVAAVKYIADEYGKKGLRLLFETGQETPVTLLRLIQDVGADNIGINFDPANLILYGKANPIDALDVVGKYVRGVHAKDGEYPVDGMRLGEEKPIGAGKVNFPVFIEKLKQIGYNGALTIEREITGEQQEKDILAAKELLEGLICRIGTPGTQEQGEC